MSEMLAVLYRAEMGIVRVGIALHVASIQRKPDGAVSIALAMASLEQERDPTDVTARSCAYIAELRLDRDHCQDARHICRALFLAPEASA